MMRIESELLDLAESISRNDGKISAEDYQTLYSIATDAGEIEDENKKLRELVRDMHKALFTLDIDHCQACPRDNINGHCTKFMVSGSDECSIEEDMRELGIEGHK